MLFRLLPCLALLLFAVPLLPGFTAWGAPELRVSGKVTDNPTISFSGVPGNPKLTEALRSFLKNCGWFELTDTDGSYTLAAAENGGRLTLRLSMGGAPVAAWSLASGQPRPTAKLAVDAILKKLFKVDTLCATRIAFCADTAKGIKNIFVCDIDGGDLQQVTNFQSLCVEPCWFPGGNSIGYTKYGRSTTDVVETRLAPTKMSRRLSSIPGLNVGISISPDGGYMALILSPDHMVDLYVRPVAGGALRRLTKGKSVEASPCWSPDSRRICFVSDESGRPRLYAVNRDGSGRTRLPSVGTEAVTPDWSTDGQIVYATRVGGVYTLAVLNLQSGENIRATMVPGTWESPAWAPDNRQVVCKRSDGPRASLFVVDTWSGKVRQLIATRNNLSMPCWSKGAK